MDDDDDDGQLEAARFAYGIVPILAKTEKRGRVVSPDDVARDRILTKPGRSVVDRDREYIKADIARQCISRMPQLTTVFR